MLAETTGFLLCAASAVPITVAQLGSGLGRMLGKVVGVGKTLTKSVSWGSGESCAPAVGEGVGLDPQPASSTSIPIKRHVLRMDQITFIRIRYSKFDLLARAVTGRSRAVYLHPARVPASARTRQESPISGDSERVRESKRIVRDLVNREGVIAQVRVTAAACLQLVDDSTHGPVTFHDRRAEPVGR
jgi:hypothetical protein